MDGDGKDDKEWFEGPAPVLTTVKFLFEMRDETSREERRKVYGRMKLRDRVDCDALAGKECECEASPTPLDDNERAARNAKESVNEKGYSSEDADEYEIDGSSCSGPRSSIDTRQKLSCAIDAKKRTKTSSVVHKIEVDEVDSPRRKLRRIATRSTTK